MSERIETPIKACHQCWANFTLTEWDKLEQTDDQEAGKPERRKCAKCGAVLELDRAGLDELDLTDDPAEYAKFHPHTARVAPIDPGPPPAKKSKPKAKKKAKAEKKAAAEPAKPAEKWPERHGLTPEQTRQIVLASLRRIAPHIRVHVVTWMRHCPPEADAFTLGDLRQLITRGPF
jgi:hypothetical protein